MAGKLDAPDENGGHRICYSCGNSYPDSVRFCPRDSADLDYFPLPIDDLSRDFRQPKNFLAILAIAVFGMVLASFSTMDRLGSKPADRAEAFGELMVRTTPAGAIVYLDGSSVGVSPVRLSGVPTGVHEVRAVFPGYSDGRARIEILPSATQRLVWDLSPLRPMKTSDRNRYLAELSSKHAPAIKKPAEEPI